MRNTYRNIVTTSIATLALGLSFAATAEEESDNFNVTATVAGVCQITAGNELAFDDYDPVDASAVDGTTTISVTCSDGMADTEVGLEYSGAMDHDVEADTTLTYVLYQEAARSTVWADTDGTDRQDVTADGTAQTMTVYGQIDAGQETATVGSYSETVTATVYF